MKHVFLIFLGLVSSSLIGMEQSSKNLNLLPIPKDYHIAPGQDLAMIRNCVVKNLATFLDHVAEEERNILLEKVKKSTNRKILEHMVCRFRQITVEGKVPLSFLGVGAVDTFVTPDWKLVPSEEQQLIRAEIYNHIKILTEEVTQCAKREEEEKIQLQHIQATQQEQRQRACTITFVALSLFAITTSLMSRY